MITNLYLALSKLTPSSFCPGVFVQRIPGTHTAAKNYNKLIKLVPGWSGSVLVQLICFNSYILNTFLYDKNLAWSLSFILNKIYEIFNTIYTKTLVPSLLIWSWAGPGSIIENKSPLHIQIMPCSTSMICLK